MHLLPGYLAVVTLVQAGATTNEHVPPAESSSERWWFPLCAQLDGS